MNPAAMNDERDSSSETVMTTRESETLNAEFCPPKPRPYIPELECVYCGKKFQGKLFEHKNLEAKDNTREEYNTCCPMPNFKVTVLPYARDVKIFDDNAEWGCIGRD